MGILPLQFAEGQSAQSLGCTGFESFDIGVDGHRLQPRGKITVSATAANGKVTTFEAAVRIDTPVELDYYFNGGILPTVLRKLAQS